MTLYKIIYEKNKKRVVKIVRNGELGELIDKCARKNYNIINIEHA